MFWLISRDNFNSHSALPGNSFSSSVVGVSDFLRALSKLVKPHVAPEKMVSKTDLKFKSKFYLSSFWFVDVCLWARNLFWICIVFRKEQRNKPHITEELIYQSWRNFRVNSKFNFKFSTKKFILKIPKKLELKMSSKSLGQNTSLGDSQDERDSVEEQEKDQNKVRNFRWKLVYHRQNNFSQDN